MLLRDTRQLLPSCSTTASTLAVHSLQQQSVMRGACPSPRTQNKSALNHAQQSHVSKRCTHHGTTARLPRKSSIVTCRLAARTCTTCAGDHVHEMRG